MAEQCKAKGRIIADNTDIISSEFKEAKAECV
jgi:hypothetical protein